MASNNQTLYDSLSVSGAVEIGDDLSNSQGSLTVYGGSYLNGPLTVGDEKKKEHVTVNGGITVNGLSVFNNNMIIPSVYIDRILTIGTQGSGTLAINGDSTLNGAVTLGNNSSAIQLTVNSGMNVAGISEYSGQINGTTCYLNTLLTIGNAYVSPPGGILEVNGNSQLNGPSTFSGNVTINSNVVNNPLLEINGTANIQQGLQFNLQTLNVSNKNIDFNLLDWINNQVIVINSSQQAVFTLDYSPVSNLSDYFLSNVMYTLVNGLSYSSSNNAINVINLIFSSNVIAVPQDSNNDYNQITIQAMSNIKFFYSNNKIYVIQVPITELGNGSTSSTGSTGSSTGAPVYDPQGNIIVPDSSLTQSISISQTKFLYSNEINIESASSGSPSYNYAWIYNTSSYYSVYITDLNSYAFIISPLSGFVIHSGNWFCSVPPYAQLGIIGNVQSIGTNPTYISFETTNAVPYSGQNVSYTTAYCYQYFIAGDTNYIFQFLSTTYFYNLTN